MHQGMSRIAWIAAAVAGLLAVLSPAKADDAPQMGCFSDGDYVFLHGGITYQYFVDQGEKPVQCTPDAVKLGLELAEDAVKASCEPTPTALCDEKKHYVQQIHDVYGPLLQQAQAEPATGSQASNAAPAAGPTAAATTSTGNGDTDQSINVKSRTTIKWVQASLQQLGYDVGKADGAVGRRTATAIRKYEKDNGMPSTGKVTVALVTSLKQRTGQP